MNPPCWSLNRGVGNIFGWIQSHCFSQNYFLTCRSNSGSSDCSDCGMWLDPSSLALAQLPRAWPISSLSWDSFCWLSQTSVHLCVCLALRWCKVAGWIMGMGMGICREKQSKPVCRLRAMEQREKRSRGHEAESPGFWLALQPLPSLLGDNVAVIHLLWGCTSPPTHTQ